MSIKYRVTPILKVQSVFARQPQQYTQLPRSTLRWAATNTQSGNRPHAFKDWKGASTGEHSTERSKKGDTHDVTSGAVAAGMKERETHEGIADATKSQGTTQRGGLQHSRKAKEEHPEAPEPIIGMNDERAQKGNR
ncbi:uncharacterized protein N7459_007302 [Penicillium hispanicum]|uniref:uncharacterized protein n=1 Tax=Penicillium hispanicum TaxID=1080232 RepID=UPI002541D22F|nr:uncharacterized protein N7459_007302 [Penicillium hispanicum]KAJ5578338.1 hypothetical protein N7459_007302 [Penicillium hispanicum]